MALRTQPFQRHPSVQRLTAAQMAVFVGHTELFAYQINAAEGLRKIYRCKLLGLTRSELHRKATRWNKVVAAPFSVWFLDDDETTYRSLNQVADAILLKRHEAEQRHQAALRAEPRCSQTSLAASDSI